MTLGAPVSLKTYFSIAVAIIFPPALHVFLVTQNMQDEDSLRPVVDIDDQSAPVMTNIKNYASSHAINIVPTLLYGRKMFPLRRFGYSIPGSRGRFPLTMHCGSFSNSLPAYYSHSLSSHIAKSTSSPFFRELDNGEEHFANGAWRRNKRESYLA